MTKLTAYSHGAGCGCKIAPGVLEQVLRSSGPSMPFPGLWVGNESKDDAAVYDLGDGRGVISTTDFFLPIVDDPYDFGRIASVNAISDVYAMGGRPLMAIAVLGWPINQLAPEIAGRVVEGAKAVCASAGIPLAGGHSIDSPEPIFGLAVTGLVEKRHLKRNDTAQTGNLLFLTKPIGVGILTTAQKKGVVLPEHHQLAVDSMLRLNQAGETFSKLPAVRAMTDVTGFGLLGHLLEMCEGSGLGAELYFEKIPRLPHLDDYLAQQCVPGGTHRNWDSYGRHVSLKDPAQRLLLADPQTSGGLLIAVDAQDTDAFLDAANAEGLQLEPIGQMIPKPQATISVL
jgi:selenide,water dikinase